MVRLPLVVVALAVVAATGGGCDDPRNTTLPTPTPVVSAPPPPPAAPPALPPLTGASVTYVFSSPLGDPGARVSRFTEDSLFVLYETGGFALRDNISPNQARGTYERNNNEIRFYFNQNANAADAIGTLKGELMEVRYSLIMLHSDFENAVYRVVE